MLGGLYWRQLRSDHARERALIPEVAERAAERLVEGIEAEVDRLLEREHGRPFYHYASVFRPADAEGALAVQHSPLLRAERPEGLLAWFSVDLEGELAASVRLFFGAEEGMDEARRVAWERELSPAVEDLFARVLRASPGKGAAGGVGGTRMPLVVPAVHRGYAVHAECLASCYGKLVGAPDIEMEVGEFELELRTAPSGPPRVLAWRRVVFREGELPLDPARFPCLAPLKHGFGLVQGFFLDPGWLFERLPERVGEVVLADERLVSGARIAADATGEARARVSLVDALGIRVAPGHDPERGDVAVSIDASSVRARHRAEVTRFAVLAGLLGVALGTGTFLLLRGVRREIEEARRMENFVAAVTHELRTPLSAIRLHGEMLLEGWVDDAAKRKRYYAHIVRETRRLSTLVERVLEKSRMSATPGPAPRPGDVNRLVEELRPTLETIDGGSGKDLLFSLEPDLPPVLLAPEAIAGILTNLIENARKYAPVDPADPAAEPIVVRTRAHEGSVVLEVADRGPGIPPAEAQRIFEAFYRVGNEATRTSRGTGLGLHLVHLHAESIGARVAAFQRKGGGALFRVLLARAR